MEVKPNLNDYSLSDYSINESDLDDFAKTMSQLRLNALEEWEPSVKNEDDLEEEENDDVLRQRSYVPNRVRGTGLIFANLKNAEKTPVENIKPEGVNPFGVYLNLDCQSDIESVIDQWETSLRVAISVNKWPLQDVIRFIEMTLLGSAFRHWKAQSEADRSIIVSGTDIGTIIS